jgi:hypothetical protein
LAAAKAAGAGTEQDIAEAALRTVKAALLEQYATAADNNRVINQGRARWRTRAGLATLTSVLAVLALVGVVMVSNVHGHGQTSNTGGSFSGSSSKAEPGSSQAQPSPAAADARGAQGLVARPSDGTSGGGLGAGRP